jgi:MerR family copper efflux transcriptional regulator
LPAMNRAELTHHKPPPLDWLTIGDAATASGVSVKMIRYYESIGLVEPANRTDGNYRSYNDHSIQTLRFVGRARQLGFSMPEITKLLALWQNGSRSSAEVKAVALDHMRDLDARIQALQQMKKSLKHLADRCHGDDRPQCPIIEDLAEGGATGETDAHRKG